jgi:hypothetical protein
MNEKPNTTAAATNIPQLLEDLDGGQLQHKLSVAMSQVAAAVVDNGACGEVVVKFKIKPIPGSRQIGCEHTIDFKRPTMSGVAGERETRTTVLFVGKYGALSLAQPTLPGMTQEKMDV